MNLSMLLWRQPYLWFQMRINMVFVAIIILTPNTPSSSAISLLNPKFGNPEIKGLARNPKMIASWQHTLKEKNWDPTSPEGSWFLFNANDSYQKKKNRRKNCKRCSKNIPMPKEGPPGPQGPRGPQGPQGESGGTLSLGEIEDYIKTYVTDLLIQNKTISLDFLKPKRRRSSFKENVPVVFTGQLPYKEKIPSQQTSVIKGFTVTFGPGQFKRGVIVRGGKFTITREGVYQVSGTIPIQQSKKFNDSAPSTGDKTISVYLCVDNCLKDRRLKWTSSFSGRTSAVFNGHVRLKRGQSMMVLMSNPTSYDVEVLPGSTFSAALLGT